MIGWSLNNCLCCSIIISYPKNELVEAIEWLNKEATTFGLEIKKGKIKYKRMGKEKQDTGEHL